MRILYLDCFSGISGDMLVGALTDLGVAPSVFEWELTKINLEDHHLHFERQTRKGIAGVKFGVHAGAVHVHTEQDHSHHDEHSHGGHDHHHHDAHHHGHHHYGDAGSHHEPSSDQPELDPIHAQRTYRDIVQLINESDLSDFAKQHSLGVFQRLATAEAKIHACPVDDVQFHEVGALDSIVDVVLACVGIESLGVGEIHFSRLVDGQGSIRCAHGEYPIPSPATLEILNGLPLSQIPVPFELITPTGAALVAEFQNSVGTFPLIRPSKTGYGLGTRDLPERANVLRAILGEKIVSSEPERLTEVQATIDDMSPELLGAAIEKIREAGAVEAFFSAVQMKKSRPGTLITALCRPEKLAEIQEIILRHTSTFGVRYREVERLALDRKFVSVTTQYGPISIKLGLLKEEVIQVAPEFEECRQAAEKAGMPIKAVYDAALQAYYHAVKQNTDEKVVEVASQ
ncbi:MAG TPA: nickel pincer cofactor biosynthesis protein LarC [Chthoniobacterales bacterium]|nr:nickel pincer cofactor biosynthesis protein LarC [Chthoniobacterales bacterium]